MELGHQWFIVTDGNHQDEALEELRRIVIDRAKDQIDLEAGQGLCDQLLDEYADLLSKVEASKR